VFQPQGDVDTPFLKIVGGKGEIQFVNVGFRTSYDSFVFCVASDPQAGGLPEAYKSVLEITSPMEFCTRITKGYRDAGVPATFVGLKKCMYEERQIALAEPLTNDEWYRKPLSFSDQLEYRAAWSPQGAPSALTPIVLVIPEIRDLVRIVD